MEGLSYLTCDEMDKAWELFYKWGELTMRQRGVNPRHWKQWVKDNRRGGKKCDKYFPTISVEEGKAKGRLTNRFCNQKRPMDVWGEGVLYWAFLLSQKTSIFKHTRLLRILVFPYS